MTRHFLLILGDPDHLVSFEELDCFIIQNPRFSRVSISNNGQMVYTVNYTDNESFIDLMKWPLSIFFRDILVYLVNDRDILA